MADFIWIVLVIIFQKITYPWCLYQHKDANYLLSKTDVINNAGKYYIILWWHTFNLSYIIASWKTHIDKFCHITNARIALFTIL